MAIIIETEIQSDLENLYKAAGDLLNEIEMKEKDKTLQPENLPEDTQQLLDRVKFRLEDISGTLQKDIYNIRHVLMKLRAGADGA